MLYANAVFNVLMTGVFDVTNVFYVFSIMFAKTLLLFFLTSHPILRCELCFLCHLFSSVFTHCVMRTTILLFVFRIMF